ncbi:MAG TPA: glycosyltransferase [Candidatus Saccharimonadales bacterium]|nr:glycosyltransferase [Candidatus Saccharimonadales bacterium]
MAHKTILLVGTYPIANPMHGGQKRVQAIVNAYRKIFDEVQFSAVFFKGFYADYDSTDVPLGPEYTVKLQASPFTGDVVSGKAIYDDPAIKNRFITMITRLKPDIIEIEQGFPYFGLRRLLAEIGYKGKLISSTHNIEAPMKREILHNAGVPKAEIDKVVSEIDAIEKELAKTSDLVIACTPSDVTAYEKMGAHKVVLAPNGMAPIITTAEAKARWLAEFNDKGIVKKILFVASAHPPAWTGFLDVVGLQMGFIGPESRILLAGGISDLAKGAVPADGHDAHIAHATFWQRVLPLGRPSDEDLGALLTLSDVIILPITEGGGSNLKTAEAILADKPIVATSHAFRAFEHLMKLPNIYIADTPAAFRQAINKALTTPPVARTAAERKMAEQVLWQHSLEALVKEVRAL